MKKLLGLLLALLLAASCSVSAAGASVAPNAAAPVSAKRIQLNKSRLTLRQGQRTRLKAKFYPANTTNQKIKWTTSRRAVAAVNQSGLVRGVRAGSAVIKATAVAGKRVARCRVTVTAAQAPPAQPPAESSPAQPPAESSPAPPVTSEPGPAAPLTIPDETVVWIPKTGKRFHSGAVCGSMKDPAQTTAGEARRKGFSACGSCWPAGSR